MRASIHEVEGRREIIPTVSSKVYPGKTGFSDKIGEATDDGLGLVTIAVVEARALNRECLTRCLGAIPGYTVAPYASLEEWHAASGTSSASIVVLAIAGEPREPEARQQIVNAVEAVDRLPVVILSDVEDPDQIMEVLHSGVRGYIPTSLPLDVAVEAMRLVRAGGVFAPANCLLAARRAKDFARSAKLSGSGMFTARQAAVVEALRRGKANKIIAYELNMSESTVKVHVRNIMKKLKAKNRTEVAFLTNALIKSERM